MNQLDAIKYCIPKTYKELTNTYYTTKNSSIVPYTKEKKNIYSRFTDIFWYD